MIIVYCTTGLNTYIDERNVKRLGSRNARCVTRVYGDVMEGPPPNILPRWMVALEYQRPHDDSQGVTTSFGHSSTSTLSGSASMHHSPRDGEMDTTSYGPMYSFF